MDVKITDQARDQIQDMMKEESSDVRLRFGVQGGGCSGLSYALGFDDEVNAELDEVNTVNDIPVVMSKMDIPMLEKTEIDFKQNMMGGGFSIHNPNAVMSCGCGSSFRTETNVGNPGGC
ncbi:MAG TPA: iron-sulfur cluster assembly accessory protein [Pseudogracilibacillus sp.]|nr:iron-sulfur cluster assembly accessory protein [Pseudogracilibacillus sp.]